MADVAIATAKASEASAARGGTGRRVSARPSPRPEDPGRPVAHFAESALAGSGGAGLLLLVIALVGRIPWRRPTHTGNRPVRGRARAMSYHPAGGRSAQPDTRPCPGPSPDTGETSTTRPDDEPSRGAATTEGDDPTRRTPPTRRPDHTPTAPEAPTAEPPAAPVPSDFPAPPAASAFKTPASPGTDADDAPAIAGQPRRDGRRRRSTVVAHAVALLRRAFSDDGADDAANDGTTHYADVIDLATERRLRRPTRRDDDSA